MVRQLVVAVLLLSFLACQRPATSGSQQSGPCPVRTAPAARPVLASATGGPYLSREDAICIATNGGSLRPAQVDAAFGTLGGTGESAAAADREVWRVWLHTPGQGPRPSGVPESHQPGKAPQIDYDRWVVTIDATTGWAYSQGWGVPP